jgi:fatty acid desaturase
MFTRGVLLVPVNIHDGTYAWLKAETIRGRIHEKSLLFYWLLIASSFGGYSLSAWAIFILDDYLLLTLACMSFTIFSVQVAGLMHDSGHRAVFQSVRCNDILGHISATLLGMVFDNWRLRHNAHHASPNEIDKDPDMAIPFLVTSARSYRAKNVVERFCARGQAYYYYPLSAVVSFTNRLGSTSYFLKPSAKLWQLCLYLPGIAFLFFTPFIVFDPAKAVFVFFLVHVSSGMYLAACFAPNHKGMAEVNCGAKLGFLEQQITTSRNVRGGFLTELLLVGLNHQIEHHLFPSCPRNKLKLLQPFVKSACRKADLPYTQGGLFETNRIILRLLQDAARTTSYQKAGEA